MRVIVTGSVAYDYLMVFPGRFTEHILADKMHTLSVSFLVESMRKQRGGTATNIAYNLALLGEQPEVVATVGEDFADYRQFLEQHGVNTTGIHVVPGEWTSSCFINTDLQDNQITAFYPGAMTQAASLQLNGLGLNANDLVVISPNDPTAMQRFAEECTRLGIPYLYDPSMQAPRMTAEELRAGLAGARIWTGNDYEFGMMAEKLGMTEDELYRSVPVCVVTRGEAGASIYADGREYKIPSASPRTIADPTGAGDAFRAGLVKGIVSGLGWEQVGRIAALAATYAIEQTGTQQHLYSTTDFLARYRENFGTDPAIDAVFEKQTVSSL